MKKLVLLLVAVSLFMASPIMAMHFTQSALYLNVCKELQKAMETEKDYDSEKAPVCMGFVTGATKMHDDLAYLNKDVDNFAKFYCLPDGANYEQIVSAWVKYLEDNPRELNLEPIITFNKAMKESFPCTESQPSK